MNYSENNFIQFFKENIDHKSLFGFDCVLFDEMQTSNGIPDIILINRKKYDELRKNNLYFSLNELNGQHSKVLKVITDCYHTKEYLLNKSGLDKKKFLSITNHLIKLKIVMKSSKGLLKLNDKFDIPKIDFWSLEFKLADWKSAIRQSIIYRSFSRVVIVVMPFKKEKLLRDNSMYFKKFGIGCIAYSPEMNKVKYIVKPTKTNKISNRTYIDLLGKVSSYSEVMA